VGGPRADVVGVPDVQPRPAALTAIRPGQVAGAEPQQDRLEDAGVVEQRLGYGPGLDLRGNDKSWYPHAVPAEGNRVVVGGFGGWHVVEETAVLVIADDQECGVPVWVGGDCVIDRQGEASRLPEARPHSAYRRFGHVAPGTELNHRSHTTKCFARWSKTGTSAAP
jgi:hypothetical protein